MATAGSWCTTWVAMMKAAIVATVLTERSMPPVSMVIVWQPREHGERDRELDGVGDPALVDDAGPQDLQDRRPGATSRIEQRHQRLVAHEAADAAADGDVRRGGRAVRHGERLLMAMKAPSITTMTMITPSMMVVTLGSTASSVRSVRTSRSTKTATIGPSRPPRPPPSVDAAEHHRRHAGEQIGAGDGRADAGAHGQRQPAHGARTGPPAHRRRSWCAPPARRCGRRRARCCRWRRSTARAASAAAGSRRRRGTRRAPGPAPWGSTG